MAIKTPYKVLFLLLVVLGVYYPSLFAPTNSIDDRVIITDLLNIEKFDLKSLFLPGTSGYYYRPLLMLTFIADKYLWGLDESFMHLENMALHALNVVLVFFIAARITKRFRATTEALPFFAALLFAVHPINTEAVNWISGRTDVLAGFFVLFSVLFLLKALDSESALWAGVSAIAYYTACLSKEVAVFFFPAALLIMFYHEEGVAFNVRSAAAVMKRRFALLGFHSAAIGFYFITRHLAFRTADMALAHIEKSLATDYSASKFDMIPSAVKAIGFYGKMLIVPWPLNFVTVSLPPHYLALGILVTGVIIYILVTKKNLISALLLASACFIAPAILVAITRMAWTPIAERYLYIPSALFCIGATFIASNFSKKYSLDKYIAAPAVVILCLASITTTQRNIVWQDNLTLFEDAVVKSNGYPAARNELAIALREHGLIRESEEIVKSNHIDKSIRNSAGPDIVRANLLLNKNDLDGARKLLLSLMSTKGDLYPKIISDLIIVDEMRLKKARTERETASIRREIITLYDKLYTVNGNPFNLYRIGQLHISLREKRKAQSYFAQASEHAPESAFYKLPAKKLAESLGVD